MEATCKICNDNRYIMVNGKREYCACERERHLTAVYPFMSNIKNKDIDRNKMKSWVKSPGLPNIRQQDALMVVDCTNSEMYMLLGALLVENKIEQYRYMTAYELRDISFVIHPIYKSIYQITDKYVCLVFGLREPENVRQVDWILQLWDKMNGNAQRLVLVIQKNKVRDDQLQEILRYANSQRVNVVRYDDTMVPGQPSESTKKTKQQRIEESELMKAVATKSDVGKNLDATKKKYANKKENAFEGKF